jgi:hypothetical protein
MAESDGQHRKDQFPERFCSAHDAKNHSQSEADELK